MGDCQSDYWPRDYDHRFLLAKDVLVTGGTGSLGTHLVRRILSGELGMPDTVTVLSRDEDKQQTMRLKMVQYTKPEAGATLDRLVHGLGKLRFVVGDVRDFATVDALVSRSDVVINAAALKQVPSCEYAPLEAIRTNLGGAENIIRAAMRRVAITVVGVSTDKACQPINAMGMTKALQERLFINANLNACGQRFVCVRYGNVMGSRGSVLPLFKQQIEAGGPVTITNTKMTRFLMTLDNAVDVIFDALASARAGETYIPLMPSGLVVDVARSMIGTKNIGIDIIGIRPGEKLHETLVGPDELRRTICRTVADRNYYVIAASVPEIAYATRQYSGLAPDENEYTSESTSSAAEVARILSMAGY